MEQLCCSLTGILSSVSLLEKEPLEKLQVLDFLHGPCVFSSAPEQSCEDEQSSVVINLSSVHV